MHVDSRMHVVEHVPPAVVRVFIHYKVITAVPAPIRADRPIPIRHLEIKPSGKPEAVMVAVKFLNVIAVRRAEMFKMSVLERMVDVIPLVVRPVVPIPVIVADMLRLINLAVWMPIDFGLPSRRIAMHRRRGYMPLVRSWHIVTPLRTR